MLSNNQENNAITTIRHPKHEQAAESGESTSPLSIMRQPECVYAEHELFYDGHEPGGNEILSLMRQPECAYVDHEGFFDGHELEAEGATPVMMRQPECAYIDHEGFFDGLLEHDRKRRAPEHRHLQRHKRQREGCSVSGSPALELVLGSSCGDATSDASVGRESDSGVSGESVDSGDDCDRDAGSPNCVGGLRPIMFALEKLPKKDCGLKPVVLRQPSFQTSTEN
jgi:hypothetical protein